MTWDRAGKHHEKVSRMEIRAWEIGLLGLVALVAYDVHLFQQASGNAFSNPFGPGPLYGWARQQLGF